MAVAGFYRRNLPSPPAIEFASVQGKQLFSEALAGGTMEGFFKLISYYQTQSEPAYCGLATLATVLNALAIDPGRTWKGPWRWFDDSMLDCCEPLSAIKVKGITFGKVACLAHCNGAKVETFRANDTTVDDFRKHIVACTSAEDHHVIVSYDRRVFKQTGTGHFSPIGGYHAGSDMVLILDVARFKYPPHWVPLTLLWEAMDTIDEATGHLRGFMIISRHQRPPSILYTLSCRNEGWTNVAKYLSVDVPLLLESVDVKDVENVLSILFKSLPDDFRYFIKWIVEVRRQENGAVTLSEEEKGRLAMKEEVLKQLRETVLFKYVKRWLASESYFCKDVNGATLPEIAIDVCCQGAELLTENTMSCCKKTDLKVLTVDDEKPIMLVSGSVVTTGNEESFDMLVPSSHREPSDLCEFDRGSCRGMHPYTSDVFTILLLVLPQEIWSGVKKEQLQAELTHLMSTDNLPSLLQEEVLHLQRQLHFIVTECCSTAASS